METDVDFEKEGYVSIWAGNFETEEEFNIYIEEKYGHIDEQVSLSDFSQDAGLGWYDHDFREAMYYGQEALPIRELMIGSSYSSSFIDEAEQIAKTKNMDRANSIFLLYDFEYTSTKEQNEKLKFLASIKYDVNAPIAEK